MYGVPSAGGGFAPYAAGDKRYGSGLMSSPTMGPVDPMGYRERDAMATARRNALLQRLKASQFGNYASAAYNRSTY